MIEISRENLIDQIKKLAKVKYAPIIGIDGMAAVLNMASLTVLP